jgi:UDP-N-acetyl-D-glucosamine dehydrogenase
MNDLKKKIQEKSCRIGIIGLGYVGLPLAVEFSNSGIHTTGVDLDQEKVFQLNNGISYIPYIDVKSLKNKNLSVSTKFEVLNYQDVIIICVSTPLSKNKNPDLSQVRKAVEVIKERLHSDQLVILESTTFPETTRKIVLPMLEQSGLKIGNDFFLAYSPERIDPGNKVHTLKNTPKLVGGITNDCTELASVLYSHVCNNVVSLSSPEIAEMAKIFENIFRNVNIALVNELKMLCDLMGINVWEVIKAAATKPFGFMPFYPGPGVGGHCVPVDPFYLSWKAKEYDFQTRFIELSGEINDRMPYYCISLIVKALNQVEKSVKGAKIMVLGVAYKKDIDDIRGSPAIKIIRTLINMGGNIIYNDPHVDSIEIDGVQLKSTELTEKAISSAECVVIATDHGIYDYISIKKDSKILVDLRNRTSAQGSIIKASNQKAPSDMKK